MRVVTKCHIVALVLAVACCGRALAFENPFDKIFYDKLYCGDHAEACDCGYAPPLGCTVDELTKICKGCKGDLYIDYRFKGKVTFWQLKDIKGSMILAEDSEVKELDFKQLKTTGEAIYLGGYPKTGGCARGVSGCTKEELQPSFLPSYYYTCPASLEAIYMPKLVGVGSKGTSYGKLIVGKPLPKLGYGGKAPAGVPVAESSGRGQYSPGCAGLYKFHAPKLQYVSSSMSFAGNDKLYQISFPHLKLLGVDELYADGSIVIRYNDNLKVIYLPQAQATGSGYSKSVQMRQAAYYYPTVYKIYGNPKLEFVMYKTNKVAYFDFDASQNMHKALVMHGVPSKFGVRDVWGDYLWETKMGAWAKVDDLKNEKLELVDHVWDEKFDWLEHKKDGKDEVLEHLWDAKWDWAEDKHEKLEDLKHEIEEKIEEKKEYTHDIKNHINEKLEEKKEHKEDIKDHIKEKLEEKMEHKHEKEDKHEKKE